MTKIMPAVGIQWRFTRKVHKPLNAHAHSLFYKFQPQTVHIRLWNFRTNNKSMLYLSSTQLQSRKPNTNFQNVNCSNFPFDSIRKNLSVIILQTIWSFDLRSLLFSFASLVIYSEKKIKINYSYFLVGETSYAVYGDSSQMVAG